MFRYLLLTLSFLLAGVAQADQPDVCKWVDEQGVVHYSRNPPEGRECRKMELDDPHTALEIEKARQSHKKQMESQSLERKQEEWEKQHELKKPHHAGRPRVPLPMNEVSVYLETLSTTISFDSEKLYGQFTLVLRPHENLPNGVILEALFPNPATPDRPEVVKAAVNRGNSKIRLQSPPFRGFQCRNYQIVVHIYEGKDRDKRLGTHYQYIQSIVDLSRVKNAGQLLSALYYGNCGED
jgi:hypothetical protein